MIAYCGIDCGECDAFLATQADDNDKRSEVAREWSKKFKMELTPESINCDGCTSQSGRMVAYCEVCPMRTCAREKEIPNCAYCSDYACDNLSGLFMMLPEAKTTLDDIRKSL